MRFGILGPLTVADGERPIAVPGAKPRTLLVMLVLQAGRVVPADRLVDGLWGEHLTAAKAADDRRRAAGLLPAAADQGSNARYLFNG